MTSATDPDTTADDNRFRERVRLRAYYLWEKDGRPDRSADHDWLIAEALEKQDNRVDEEEEESFPASDPPSQTGSSGPKIGPLT
jgi:hypothetical protein